MVSRQVLVRHGLLLVVVSSLIHLQPSATGVTFCSPSHSKPDTANKVVDEGQHKNKNWNVHEEHNMTPQMADGHATDDPTHSKESRHANHTDDAGPLRHAQKVNAGGGSITIAGHAQHEEIANEDHEIDGKPGPQVPRCDQSGLHHKVAIRVEPCPEVEKQVEGPEDQSQDGDMVEPTICGNVPSQHNGQSHHVPEQRKETEAVEDHPKSTMGVQDEAIHSLFGAPSNLRVVLFDFLLFA
mmetsp:Transcript_49641/g.105678  ORF Transcript_49641/g.105678 Transcript_49641/m.105678 type:complete len:240 (+) Transcript_49641:2025-2744(+)